MNAAFVKLAPPGDFVEVSALRRDWQDQLQTLIGQKHRIKFDFYPLANFPGDIQERLKQNGYHDLILENDQWQHFLIPNPN